MMGYTRNEQMSTRSPCTRMEDQRKDCIDPKGPSTKNRLEQLQTYNVPTYDAENTNGTIKERDLFLANKPSIVP